MLNRKLFLLALIAMLCVGASALIISCSVTTSSSSDDDDTSPFSDDDDNDDNDDNDTTDDDDDNDDDSSPIGDCATVAQDMCGTCQVFLKDIKGNTVDQAGTADWCSLCEQLFSAKTVNLKSPFWTCMDNCAVVQFCDQNCFNGCLQPADPGGTGCDHTTFGIYSCGVAFVFNANPNYYIPESDEMKACATDGANWTCFATCVANNHCDNPPTQDQANALIACMNAC